MKRMRKLLIAAAVVIIFCLLPASQLAHTADDPFVTDLIAGQHIDAGSVIVWNDDTTLYIKFQGEDGWLITETHVAVEVEVEDIPTNGGGNPKIGKFEYASEHKPGVESYTHEIPLDWPVGTSVYIAGHAVVWHPENGEETAWGCYEGTGGAEFEGRRWGCYFDYEIQRPPEEPGKPNIEIPEGPVDIYIQYVAGPSSREPWAAGPSYFDIQVFFDGTYANIESGTWYDGWCADEEISILDYLRENTDVAIYSSMDTASMPWYAKDDEQWDRINYILNNKHPDATYMDIQQAIWCFADAGYTLPADATPAAVTMYENARDYGAYFVPSPGDMIAVILDLNDGQTQDIQLVFIEIDP